MPAVLRPGGPSQITLPVKVGPQGPFPARPLSHVLERRWLHYAFLSRDNELGMVSNVAWLGPDPENPGARQRCTSILLLYRRGAGWRASQFNTETSTPLWSAFRMPHAFAAPGPLNLSATSGEPAVNLKLQRSSHPCTSQCAPFATNQHFRWQSETGILAKGTWRFGDELFEDMEAVGYHERVRGRWGWPEMGGWVFGFANDPQVTEPGGPPPTAVVFTLIQPQRPAGAPTASVMLWRDGRLKRHFPRRNINVVVRGQLDRDRVRQVPELANLFNTLPMAPVPRRLIITAHLGHDRLVLDFESAWAARIVNPNETGIDPFSVHEVVGPCHIEGNAGKDRFAFESYGIVEFAGGAGGI